MSAIYKEGAWYGGAVDAKDISIKIGQNNLELAETVQNIVKDLAPIETNSTNATTSYKTGDLLTHNGVLYRVINNITAGDPLIEGTNITETTITQGVDLTNRVVALENKTQKISQISNNDGNYLQVDNKGLKINNLFLAGQNGATTALNNTVGLLLRKPERSIDVYINGDNTAGIYDRGNTKWILRSNDEGTEVKTDASTFVCGSSLDGSAYRVRAANSFHRLDLLASNSGRCGILDRDNPADPTNGKWLIFLEASTNVNPNASYPETIKTGFPFYLNSTTVANLTSRGLISAPDNYFQSGSTSNTAEARFEVTNKVRSGRLALGTGGNLGIWDSTNGNWIIYSTTDQKIHIQHPINNNLTVEGSLKSNATTVTSLTNSGNTNLAATSVTSLTNTGNTSLKATAVTSLNSSGEIITSTHLSAGTDDATGEHVCRVRNKYRRLQFSTGNSSSSASPAGIWDLGTGKTGWVINSQTRNNRIQVEIPQVFLTKTVLDSTLRPPILTGGLSNTKIMIGAIYGEAKGMRAQSYFEGSSYVVKHFVSTDSDRRLKTNIKLTSRSGLDLINQLEIVEFDWKNNNQHWNYGIIAQDAAKIDKNIVIGEEKEDEYLAIDTLYLVDALVKATQELSAEVDQLKERVKILEKEKDKKSQ